MNMPWQKKPNLYWTDEQFRQIGSIWSSSATDAIEHEQPINKGICYVFFFVLSLQNGIESNNISFYLSVISISLLIEP